MADQAFAKVVQDFFPLVGGLDEETPPIATKPGSIIGSQNYDVAVHGGYRRIDGYERFDGRPRPSDASYTVLTYTGASGLSVGDTIVGETSGATATLIDNPQGQHVTALVTGTFQVGESVGGTPDAPGVDPASFSHVVGTATVAEGNIASIEVTLSPTTQRSLLVLMVSVWKGFPGVMPTIATSSWVTDTDGNDWSNALWSGTALVESYTGMWFATNAHNTDNHPITVTFTTDGRTFNATVSLVEFLDDRIISALQATNGTWTVDNNKAQISSNTGVDPSASYTPAAGYTHSIVFAALSTAGDGNGPGAEDTNVNAVEDPSGDWVNFGAQQNGATGAGALHSYRYVMSNTTFTWDPSADVGFSDWSIMLFPVQISASTPGGTILAVEQNAADSIDDHLAYKCLAADAARDNIAAPTGFGKILGVVMYNDVVYAFRGIEAEGGVRMFRHDATTGWTQLGPNWPSFWFDTGATVAPAVGDTLTQGANTATVQKVVIFSGTFAGGDAVGRIWHTAPTPATFAVGAITYTTGSVALIAEPTYDPIGGGYEFFPSALIAAPDPFDFRFEFAIGNITGSQDGPMLYIVGGDNPPMEFDGTVLADIRNGMPEGNFPTHVAIHKQHLFLSYGTSLQHSAINNPWSWTLLTGAAELNVTDTITGLLSQLANEGSTGALAVFSRNSTRMLYGASSADWQLVQSSPDTGAIRGTMQNIGIALYLDDRGMMLIRSQQEFGNFNHSSVSRKTQQFFDSRRGLSTCSMVIPSRNQYRVFFSDGSGAAVTMEGRKVLGIAALSYGVVPWCAWASEQSDGTERLFIGATNGFVYEVERGTSFDGNELPASMRLSFHHSRSPYSRKRYRVSIFETKVAMRATLDIQSALSSDEEDPATPASNREVVYGGGGYYDVNAYYNQSFFDSAPYSKLRYKIDGTGRNIGFIISNVSRCEPSHTLTGVTLHFSPRRLER